VDSTDITAILLIALPVLFNVSFGLLAARFDYPEILREPSRDVLSRFKAGGSTLILIWWAFAMSAVLFAAVVTLLPSELGFANLTVVALSITFGLLASIVQFLGLIRWPFLAPYLARVSEEAKPGSSRAEAVDVVFESFNRYLGVGVGEHLGYALTGVWTTLIGVQAIQGDVIPGWLGAVGLVAGPLFLVCSAEFLGPFERDGWKPAGALVPIVYVVWSLWLAAIGVTLLV
jgi:hypothetical protein